VRVARVAGVARVERWVALLLFAGPLAAQAKTVALAVNLTGEAERAARAALTRAGWKVLDASDAYYALLDGLSPLKMGKLDADPPESFAENAALVADHRRGTDACKARAGKPPYGLANAAAFVCGGRLAEALFQRYLDALAPDLVVEINLKSTGGPRYDLRVSGYAPGSERTRSFAARRVALRDTGPLAARLALDVAVGRGGGGSRVVARELPETSEADSAGLALGLSQDLPGPPIPAGCRGPLPQALELPHAAAPFAATVARQWSNTVSGSPAATAPPLACKLVFRGEPLMAGAEVKSWVGTLFCGEEKFEATVLHIEVVTAQRQVSSRIVQKLLESRCR
jgi:hypothetical protein